MFRLFRVTLLGFWFILGGLSIFVFLVSKGLNLALFDTGPRYVEPQPAEKIASKLRTGIRRAVRWMRRGEIVDHDVYYRNHVINVYLKVRTEEPLIPDDLPSELVVEVRQEVHDYMARKLCTYLVAAQGARSLDISIVKADMTDSFSIKLYKGECASGA